MLSGGDKKESPIDRHYHGLNCTLTPVDHEDEEFGLVEKYVHQTHAKTHSQYRLEVKELFQVQRQGEAETFKDVGNRYVNVHLTLHAAVSLATMITQAMGDIRREEPEPG